MSLHQVTRLYPKLSTVGRKVSTEKFSSITYYNTRLKSGYDSVYTVSIQPNTHHKLYLLVQDSNNKFSFHCNTDTNVSNCNISNNNDNNIDNTVVDNNTVRKTDNNGPDLSATSSDKFRVSSKAKTSK